MKKRILTLALVLALLAVLATPMAVLAQTTDVGGNVISGYTFTPPTAIAMGNLAPSATPHLDSSTDGSLVGNNTNGYTVTGIDAKGTNTGKMVSGSNVLAAVLQIGPSAASVGPADAAQSFVDTAAPTNTTVELHVSQVVAYTDPVATGYTITITFTVTAK